MMVDRTGFTRPLISFVLIVVCWDVVCWGKCPETPAHGHLSFTKNFSSRAFVRNGHEETLECCAEGYDTLEWSFLRNNTSTWKPFPFYYKDPYDNSLAMHYKNQSLMLLRSGDDDGGMYSCRATNLTSNMSIQHNTTLEVYECTDRGKPLPICPSPTDVYANPGDNISFVCGGDFGCKDSGLRSVDWYINGNDIRNYQNGRYAEILKPESGGTVIYSKLVINGVQNEDFNVNFTCWITSDYDQGNHQCAMVHIHRLPRGLSLEELLLVSVVPAVCVLSLIMISAVVHLNCGPQIQLFVKSRVSWFKFIDKGNKRYHVFVCHGEDDNEELAVVDAITKELKDRGYHVVGMREDDIYGGQCRLEAACNLLEKSASVICIGGKNISDEQKHMIQTIKSDVEPIRITVVLIQGADKKYPSHEEFKGLVAVKWPGQKCRAMKKEKFYCSLQLRLPKKMKVSLERGEEHDERQVLLQTPTTASTTSGGSFDFHVNDMNGSETNRNDHTDDERFSDEAQEASGIVCVKSNRDDDEQDVDQSDILHECNGRRNPPVKRDQSAESGYNSPSSLLSV